MPAKPQDHKKKADVALNDGAVYTFEHEGKTYRLPSGETAVPKISGKIVRDAIMGGEQEELRLGFTLLEEVDADPGALEALYSMPAADMLTRVKDWMQFKADPKVDASLGESSSSSD